MGSVYAVLELDPIWLLQVPLVPSALSRPLPALTSGYAAGNAGPHVGRLPRRQNVPG